MTAYVYIIQAGNKNRAPIKIGVSDDPFKRLKQLQTGNAELLRLLMTFECDDKQHAFTLEKTLHEMLSNESVLNEWFSCNKNQVTRLISDISNSQKYSRVKTYDGIFSEKSSRQKDRKARKDARRKIKSELYEKRYARDPHMEILKLKLRDIRARRERKVLRQMLLEFDIKEKEIKERYLKEIGAKGKDMIENISKAREGLPIDCDNDTIIRILGFDESE